MDVVLVGLSVPGVENHATRALRSALRSAGLDVAFVPFGGFADMVGTVRRVLALRPRVVGVSLQTIESALATAVFTRLLRRSGFDGRTVVGGHFATLNSSHLLKAGAGIDAVVRFAGEEALVAIAKGALDDERRRREVPGLVFMDPCGVVRSGAPPRLTSASTLADAERFEPLPEHLGFVAADLVASQGCEAHCAYCCVAGAADELRAAAIPHYERRTVDALAREIAFLNADHGARVFNFMDDNVLPLDPEDAAEWAEELKARLDAAKVPPVAMSLQLRADVVTERSARALARLGLARAYVGIDGYSAPQLRALGRRADAECGRRALDLLFRNGVFSVVNALLVGPTIPFPSVQAEIEALARIEHAPVHLLPIEVRAGTSLFRAAAHRGLVEGGFLYWHYRFADERTERMAEILTSFPTRLEERSVPIAMYDLGYNLGIARRLLPEADLAHHAATFARVAAAWNEDQIRVLRGAARVASTGDRRVCSEFAATEAARVASLDRALRAAADGALVALEVVATRLRRRPASAHSRGKLLGGVAFSMSLAACGGAVSDGTSTVSSGPDASLGAGGASGATSTATGGVSGTTSTATGGVSGTTSTATGGVSGGEEGGPISGSGGSVPGPRPATPDGGPTTCADPGRTIGVVTPESAGYKLDVCCCEGDYLVTFDAEGRAVGFGFGDGGASDGGVMECVRSILQSYCYPSFAGKTIRAFIPHFWIA